MAADKVYNQVRLPFAVNEVVPDRCNGPEKLRKLYANKYIVSKVDHNYKGKPYLIKILANYCTQRIQEIMRKQQHYYKTSCLMFVA